MRTIMNWFSNIASGIASIFHPQRVERELDEELQGYLEASAAHKERNGMTQEEARRAASVELGSSNSVKHQVWSSRWESTVDGIVQDLRVSVRSLAKSPGFTAVALLSLALGIGGNTAIFTLINQVLLRNLPVRDPQQLVAFSDSTFGGIAGGIDLGAFGGYFPWDFTRQMQTDPGPFQGIAAYGSFSNKVSIRPLAANGTANANSPALLAPANLVSGNYFSVLGAQPLLGRAIQPSDDATPGSGAVTVLSYHFWQQSLSFDPHILGKSISINGTPFEVVGVMPQGFHGIKQELEPTELWTPISMQTVVLQHPSMLTPHSGMYFLHLFGRLSPGSAANKAEFAQCQNWLNQQVHNGIREREGSTISADREREISRVNIPLVPAAHGVSLIRSQYGESLQILMIVVALVLLIACANLANFLLSRAATRRHEILTRLALGSSRMRIVRQGLIETFLLSIVGGLMGLAVAFVATRALIAFVSQGDAYIAMSPAPNLSVLFFTLAVSLMTGILFGLAPSINAARIGAHGTLSAGARTVQSGGGKMSRFWPKALVTVQVMLSLVLLVVAGLFLRTLRNLQDQDYGFERTHLLLAEFDEQLAGYAPHQAPALHQILLERLSAIPGVRSAALSATPPISGGTWSSNISLAGYNPGPKENMVSVLNRVSGQYFETAGISIVAGRTITPADTANSLKVVVVNQTLARKYFPKGDAIGRQLTIGIDSVKGPWQIVGIARDTKSGNPRETDPVRMTYIPLAQIDILLPFHAAAAVANSSTNNPIPREQNEDCYARTILIRTTNDPAMTIADLRAAVAEVDPNLPLLQITTIHDQVSNLISHDELISTLTGLFSLLALLLAAIGLYGVMSYNVARRTNEIGIRLAVGAQGANILRMIMRESLVLLAIGTSLGLPLAMMATRIIKEQLFAIDAIDPISFAVALLVVSLMTVIAGWLPARRAANVDPTTALRCE
jgi:predicted permease